MKLLDKIEKFEIEAKQAERVDHDRRVLDLREMQDDEARVVVHRAAGFRPPADSP